MGWGLGLVTGQIAKGLPNEADEFPGDGDEDFVAMESPGGQFVEPAVETVLGFPAGFEDQVRLAFLPPGQLFAHLRRLGVVLGTFNEQPAGVRVAAFGAEPPGGERDRLAERRGEARTCGSR